MSDTEEQNAELAACPFCGGVETSGVSWSRPDGLVDTITCPGCGAIGPTAEDEAEARAAWNRRIEAPGQSPERECALRSSVAGYAPCDLPRGHGGAVHSHKGEHRG